eukprot:7419874-Ditylum_brightwellii.AAC.1
MYHNKKASIKKEKIRCCLVQHRILLHSLDKMDRDGISSLDTWCSVNKMTLCEMIMNQRTHDDNCPFIAVGQSIMRDGLVSFIFPKSYAVQAM